jgi:Ca2+-binding RTX toxin-like protein
VIYGGIDPSDIRMWTDGSGNLNLQDTSDPSHSITVAGNVTGFGTAESTIGQYLEQVTFDDIGHTTWDLTGGLTLTGDNSGDSLYGTAYNDVITGGSGADYIYGNGGNDVIYGAGGADYLTGGAGADTFLFKAATALGSSVTIADFNAGDGDKIDLHDVISTYDPLTMAISDFVQLTTSGPTRFFPWIRMAFLYSRTAEFLFSDTRSPSYRLFRALCRVHATD